LLGIDEDGRLVVFELKRGTLTREAVAQIIDYASYLAELEPEELSKHISSRSGNLGINKVDDFLLWYQEQYGKTFTEYQKPRMILVGLGADDRTKRMVSFLSESDFDISLITFHGFKKGKEVFLARQVEVQSRQQYTTTVSTKIANLEKLKSKVKKLNVESFYYDIAAFVSDKLPASYEWPNQGGYSYYLPEQTESGSPTNRVYLALYVHDNKPNKIQIYIHERAVIAASNYFQEFKNKLTNQLSRKNDGAYDIWVKSQDDWSKLKNDLGTLCDNIIIGWKQNREQKSQEEFELAET
jgi:hypothetical protein